MTTVDSPAAASLAPYGLVMIDDTSAAAWREEQRATYSSGDPELLARRQRPLAARLVEAAGVQPGELVVDIGAGTGNVAVEAARRGAHVTAVDLTLRQVETGRARCSGEGVSVQWHVADAEQLPLGDASVDVALSGFGIVYAARPDQAAREVCRVLRPGGRLVLTAYPRDSFNGRALEVVNRYLSDTPVPAAVDEYLWSDPEVLSGWFPGRAVDVVQAALPTDPYPSADAWFEDVLEVPIVARLHATLPPDRFGALRAEVIELREKYAELDPDGTLRPYEGYVVVRVT